MSRVTAAGFIPYDGARLVGAFERSPIDSRVRDQAPLHLTSKCAENSQDRLMSGAIAQTGPRSDGGSGGFGTFSCAASAARH